MCTWIQAQDLRGTRPWNWSDRQSWATHVGAGTWPSILCRGSLGFKPLSHPSSPGRHICNGGLVTAFWLGEVCVLSIFPIPPMQNQRAFCAESVSKQTTGALNNPERSPIWCSQTRKGLLKSMAGASVSRYGLLLRTFNWVSLVIDLTILCTCALGDLLTHRHRKTSTETFLGVSRDPCFPS